MESPLNPSSQEGNRGSVVCAVIGIAASGIGAICYFAARSSEANTNQESFSAIGGLLLVIGLPLFAASLLLEFFGIGTSLRAIAKSSEAALSLLRIESARPDVPHATSTPKPISTLKP